jgi:type I restriction enzyme S subunit
MNVLLSIKPEFGEKILSQQKKYEFRKNPITKADSINNVILYASSPIQRIIGFFEIKRVICESPQELWERYGEESGINDKSRFMNYYSGYKKGYAVEISNPQRLRTAVDPREHIDGFKPPVSFQYINGELNDIFDQNSVEVAIEED